MKSIFAADGAYIASKAHDVTGTSGADTLADTAAADSIDAGAGNDSIDSSLGGSDTLIGGAGNDTITIERGADAGKDKVHVDAGTGDDHITYTGSAGNKVSLTIDGGDGADTITATDISGAKISGGAGDDAITVGNAIGGSIDGGAGANTIVATGLSGADYFIFGGSGVDTVTVAGSGHSIVHTAHGDDVVNASADSADARGGISTGDGADKVNLSADNFAHYRLRLGAGQDVVNLSASTDTPIDGSSAKMVFRDFQAGDSGDRLNLNPYLQSVLNHGLRGDLFADHHLQLVEGTTPDGHVATYLEVDFDGAKNGANWVKLAVFIDVHAADITSFNLGGLNPIVTTAPEHDGLVI